MNNETHALFEESDGYGAWAGFLDAHAGPNVVPCLLYVEDGSEDNFKRQAKVLHERYGVVCLRTSAADDLARKLVVWLADVVPQDDIIMCGVLYYIEHGREDFYQTLATSYIQDVVGNRMPRTVLLPGSSFPRYVTELPGCEDERGSFPASELALEAAVQAQFPNRKIEPSDFAAVHPIRYPAAGGNWIPRVDVFTGMGFSYHRVRRDDGGYSQAARAVTSIELSALPTCWGKRQIELARQGSVPGGSPSFWISVRVNCWITARVTE